MSQLKIAVVGAGGVGTTLGRMASRKHLVAFGVRDVVKYANLAGGNISVHTVSDAIKWGDLVVVALPGGHTDTQIKELAAGLGPEIKGKVVVDATNPLTPYPGLEVRWTGTSAGEVLAAELPDSTVYKAFNTLGQNLMSVGDGSTLGGEQLTLMYAGGPAHKEQVEEFISSVGFKPVHVGPIRYARNLEALAELWIHLGVPGVGTSEKWGRDFHFQVLRK